MSPGLASGSGVQSLHALHWDAKKQRQRLPLSSHKIPPLSFRAFSHLSYSFLIFFFISDTLSGAPMHIYPNSSAPFTTNQPPSFGSTEYRLEFLCQIVIWMARGRLHMFDILSASLRIMAWGIKGTSKRGELWLWCDLFSCGEAVTTVCHVWWQWWWRWQ